MDDKKKKTRCSEKQLDYLIDFMLSHPKFGRGQFQGVQGKKGLNDRWQSLSKELNEIGPQKTTEQWKRVWKNQKLLTRKKNSDIKIASNTTGNPPPLPPLSERDRKLLAVVGKESSEGFGFAEGSIGPADEIVLNIDRSAEFEEPMANFEKNMEHIPTETEFDMVDSERVEIIDCSMPETPHETIYPKAKQPKLSKEYDLFENLIKANNDGFAAIACALKLLANSNNNIANGLLQINDSLKMIYSSGENNEGLS